MDFIPQTEPWFDQAEADAVRNYMLSGGWVTEFHQTRAFEERLCNFTGANHCIATTSGTMALVLALLVVGVGPGDEVIVPDLTMIATPNAARLLGAKPVFVDVEPATLNLDIDKVAAVITRHTKAIIHVSLNGRSNDLDRLKILCREQDLYLIEDAAQSLGSYNRDRHLGTIGDIGCFSFSVPKVVTTGQGGAVITNDDQIAIALRKLKDFGRTEGGNDIHDTMGFNFKFTDVQAVIGIEQMKKLPGRLERKKDIWRRYAVALQDVGAVSLIGTDLTQVSPWFIDIYVDARDRLQAFLKERGVGSRPVYPPIHTQAAYDLGYKSFPVTERFSTRGLWLPSASQLTDDQIDHVCEAIGAFYAA